VWRWDHQEPFGNNPPDEDPDGNSIAFEFNLRFPGQYFDRETNLAYNYYRDYSPDIGRYVESDPIGLQAGLNTYAYVNSAPTMFIDPDGNQAAAALGGFGSTAGGLSAFGPAAALAAAGLGGYGLGTLIYPMIEPGLSRAIDYCLAKEKPDEEFCKKRKQYCITFCQYELGMPGRRDNFGPFRACIRRCMNAAGCMDY
jgi:RHS repeat-associated protein